MGSDSPSGRRTPQPTPQPPSASDDTDAGRHPEADAETLWTVLADTPARIAYIDRDRRYRFVNAAYAGFLGRRPEQIVGATLAEIRGSEAAARLEPEIAQVLAGQTRRGEGWTRDGDGAPRYIDWIYRPHRTETGAVAGYFVMIRDTTELKETQESLRESEERFRSIAEAHPVPVVIVRMHDGLIRYASPATARAWGLPLTQIVGSPVQRFYADPREREVAIGLLRRRGGLDAYEVHYKRADGTVFPAAITVRPIRYLGEDCTVAGIFDLSEEKAAQAERAQQREMLHQSEKLNALGVMLAGISHELNNPLSVVVGQALMLQESAADPAVQERARRIGAAADRCARIVKSFLAMARQEPAQRGEVRLNDVVHAALELTGYMLRSADIAVVTDLSPGLPAVWADKDQLAQVLMNLVVNAQQALLEVAGERRISVATRYDPVAGEVILEVADSGPGVPAELRSRIFEPFFTTKPVGSGTGVGLAVTRGILEAHGGAIRLTDDPAEGGARFVVSLPAMRQARRTPADTCPPCGEGRRCRLLVVDDESDILEMLQDILIAEGHEVLTATSGVAALDIAMAQPVDAILSDLRMPGADGPALYRALAEQRPGLLAHLAFITGDTLAPSLRRFLDKTRRPCLEKPFTPGEVRTLVQGLIAGTAGGGTAP